MKFMWNKMAFNVHLFCNKLKIKIKCHWLTYIWKSSGSFGAPYTKQGASTHTHTHTHTHTEP
jgi:hypothetical protein